MADQGLTESSAFHGWNGISHASFVAKPRESLTMATVAPVRGQEPAFRNAIGARYGVELPTESGRWAQGRDIAFLWSGPGQWLAVAERGRDRDLEQELRAVVGDVASVVDQSDGRVVVRLGGQSARDVLAKGVPIDLHPRAFRPGDVAITHASHIGIILWQLDDAPTYEVALFRSYGQSFAHWLDEAAAEFAIQA